MEESERYPMKILFWVLAHRGGQTPERGCRLGLMVPDISEHVKNENTRSSLMPEEEREFF